MEEEKTPLLAYLSLAHPQDVSECQDQPVGNPEALLGFIFSSAKRYIYTSYFQLLGELSFMLISIFPNFNGISKSLEMIIYLFCYLHIANILY